MTFHTLSTSSNRTRQQTGVVAAALIVWSLVMLWLCWSYGIASETSDYPIYISHWQLLLDGANPWLYRGGNGYGPLHTVIGFLLPWGKLVPKFFMVSAMLMANAALVFELMRERGVNPIQTIYLLSVPTNLMVVGVGVMDGLNDTFVAALLIFAVLLRYRGYLLAAGMLVGLAALTKYYPLMLLPFFALDERRLNWSVIACGIAIFCIGFVAALAIWGQGPIDAMVYGVNREAKLLSIIAALKSLFGDASVVGWLIRYNACFVVFGVVAAFLFAWRARLNWLEGAVLGYLVMLTAYKTGSGNYYLPWLFLVAALPLVNKSSADRMAIIFLPAVLLISLADFGYRFASDGFGWVRSYGGFIAFAVSAASITLCATTLWRSPPTPTYAKNNAAQAWT
jgi:Glycosyltransferase family 87